MWVRVRQETRNLPEEWINLNMIENIEIDRDDKTISFQANETEYTYEMEDNEDDFLAVQNALKGIKPIYQQVKGGG